MRVDDDIPEAGSLFAIYQRTFLLYEQLGVAWRKRLGINATDHSAMLHLINGGPVTAAELSRRLGISSASVVEMIARLEKRELVARRQHPADRRKQFVYPTKRAYQVMRELWQPLTRDFDQLAATLDDREQEILSALLGDARRLFTRYLTAPSALGAGGLAGPTTSRSHARAGTDQLVER